MYPGTCQDLNIIKWPRNSTVNFENTGFIDYFLLTGLFVSIYPVDRLMVVEDELRGGAIPDIKPRILTDQVCACVYIFYHLYSPNRSCRKTACIILTSHPEHFAKARAEEKLAAVMHSTYSHLFKSTFMWHLKFHHFPAGRIRS